MTQGCTSNSRRYLVGLALIVGVAAAAEACYLLTQTVYPGNSAQGVVTEHRKGEPLTAPEKAGVQAAIDMLKRWETNCGVNGDSPAGGPTAPKPSEQLQAILDAGNLCREVKGDPNTVGATASNMTRGSGVDNPPGTQAGGGSRWDTSGHPGVNIAGGQIPPVTPGGSFTSGGQTFDGVKVANAAGQLLHETSHLSNPQNSLGEPKEYEAPAYTYEATELCKVAGCASEPADVKEAVCKLILDCNKQLCKFKKPQVNCPACQSLNPPITTAVPCPTPPSGGGQHLIYQQVLAAAAVPVVPVLLPDLYRELYAHGNVSGTIWLDRVSQLLTISVASSSVAFQYEFNPDLQSGLNFTPLSFTQNSRSSLIMAGFDTNSLAGKLVLLEYNIVTGAVPPATVIYTGSAFTRPSSIAKLPGVPSLAVFDSEGHEVFIHELRSGTSSLVASGATYPSLLDKTYVSVLTYNDPGSSMVGLVLMASVDPPALVDGPSTNTFKMFDFDGDGTFDFMQ